MRTLLKGQVDSAGRGWGLRLSISNELPGHDDAAGLLLPLGSKTTDLTRFPAGPSFLLENI